MPKVKTADSDVIATKRASLYGTSEPRFLWFPFIPYKKLTVLQGESGIGKSSFILNIAALLSCGKHMPFDTGDHMPDCGDILYFNREDDIEETINPRLIAMGANLERFHYADEPFYLEHDCRRLEATINDFNIRLVIIDPLTSFLERDHNMNTAQSVGNLMRGLSRVAFATGSAIVVVCHLTKTAYGKEIDRHLGSSDIMNAARSVLSVTRENEDSDVVIVKHLKSTLARRAKPFYYEIVGNGVMEFSDISDTFEEDALPTSKRERAKEFLMTLLEGGEVDSTDVYALADEQGIPRRTLERAKSELGARSVQHADRWVWVLD